MSIIIENRRKLKKRIKSLEACIRRYEDYIEDENPIMVLSIRGYKEELRIMRNKILDLKEALKYASHAMHVER